MQQRDYIKDQIKQAGTVLDKAIARYFDFQPSHLHDQLLSKTKSTLHSTIDLDIDHLINISDQNGLQQYLNEKYLSTEHLDLLSEFLYEVGKQKIKCHTSESQLYLSTCIKVLDIISCNTDLIRRERINLRSNAYKLITKKLLVLSDMYGYENGEIPEYMRFDLDGYECQYFDVRQLADIDSSRDIHDQFVISGITKAVNTLLEKITDQVSIIAFSIGGSIAWKAALNGLNVNHLIAVSSTRLRLETSKPKGPLSLIYAEMDKHKPDNEWFNQLEIKPNIIPNETHEMYKHEKCRSEIISILSNSQ